MHPLATVAARYVGVKEQGQNQGAQVEAFQKAVDGKAQGEPWCMAFVQFCIKELEKESGVYSNVYRSEHCLSVWRNTPAAYRRQSPASGDLVIWQFDGTDKGHVGIVEEVHTGCQYATTIEGNTGDGSGVVREGDGVYRRSRSLIGSGNMKIVGFLNAFPQGVDK